MIYRVASAHEEGGERLYAVSTAEFVGDADGRSPDCGCTRCG
jgi:glutamate synthase (NADPH/NADH) small chain